MTVKMLHEMLLTLSKITNFNNITIKKLLVKVSQVKSSQFNLIMLNSNDLLVATCR